MVYMGFGPPVCLIKHVLVSRRELGFVIQLLCRR
jgi:hypothetical protein